MQGSSPLGMCASKSTYELVQAGHLAQLYDSVTMGFSCH